MVHPIDEPVPQGANALPGRISRITYFGERSEASVDVSAAELLVYLPIESSLRVGDSVMVTFAPANCIPLPA